MGDGAVTHDDDSAPTAAEDRPADVAAFVGRFGAAWAAGAEGLRGFEELLTPDIVLTQPLLPEARGPAGFRAQFDALFAAVPDLRGEVLSWGPTDDGVLIELALRGTLGGRSLELVTCDRVVLRDGLMAARHARMDVTPLLRASLASPGAALPLLRSLLGRGGGRASSGEPVVQALAGLAIGRLVLGAAGRLAPHATARAFGATDPASAELAYMTRVFGARAIALGSGYLLSRGSARRVWQRLALGVDVSDTIAGLGHLRRHDIARPKALALTALTGSYAAIGAVRLARELADGD